VDENLEATRCHAGEPGCLRNPDGTPLVCRTHDLWSALGRQIRLFLEGVTLDDVVAGRMRAHPPAVETVA
jgi:Rrf2 family iron-sulfur cluster assembly transcriptional regulator